ncbi:hypothetical protein MMC10_005374 [Thelotrema lepadinum]|nr:hypothetical protein [Thelotrema lepadinum]
MPPALSDSESEVEEVIMPKRPKKQETPPKEENGADEDEEDDEDEVEETTYVVEKVLGHDIDRNVVKYEVKWQGYDETENTWEPEENLVGAQDILEAYFEDIGGRPSANSKAKKRGRKSNTSAVETPEPSAKKTKTGFEGRRGRPPKGESSDNLAWPAANSDDWQPPKPIKDAWEDLLVIVETIEVEENGSKWAFIQWVAEDEHGKKRTSRAPLKAVYTAAPQAMLRFYESHLVFTDAKRKLEDS